MCKEQSGTGHARAETPTMHYASGIGPQGINGMDPDLVGNV